MQIFVGDLKSGFYFVEINQGEEKLVRKIIKNKKKHHNLKF
jgi:hypothetical protein